jgi:hypothetical protein
MILHHLSLNIVVRWLAHAFFQDDPGSVLSPETSYSDRFCVVFVCFFTQMLGYSLK